MIKIDKVSKDNKNYKYKIIISFFVYAISIVLTIILVYFYFNEINNYEKFKILTKIESKNKIDVINKFNIDIKKESINLNNKDTLLVLLNSTLYKIYIVNDDKVIQNKNNNIKIDNVEILFKKNMLSQIYNTKNTKYIKNKNMFIQKLSNKLYFIYTMRSLKYDELRKNDNKMTFLILLVTLIFAIPFIFILGRPLKNMFEIIILQADKLHELASNLDELVEIKTQENAKKDRILQHQSKLAELGEMIANIAHQWKHPLTRLSLLSQNLKLYKQKDKLTDKIFYKTLENGTEQIEFMVKTIDNFRNFYKTNNEKEDFTISSCIDEINNIIGEILIHNNIKLQVKDYNIIIYGVKNQLSQVLLNIIVNSKDAFIKNNIKNPIINIEIYNQKDNIFISIKDNAGGIQQDIIDNIFDAYFTTKKLNGTGIGLYMSKIIIEEKFNGKIDVNNTEDGVNFCIKLLKK